MFTVRGSCNVGHAMLPFGVDILDFKPELAELSGVTYPLRSYCVGHRPLTVCCRNQRCPTRQNVRLMRKRPKKNWQQKLSLKAYQPDEIEVKTKGGMLSVHAKTQRENEDGTYYRSETSQQFSLPSNVNAKDIRSYLQDNGMLMLKAPFSSGKTKAVTGCQNKVLPLQAKKMESENKDVSFSNKAIKIDVKKITVDEKGNVTMEASIVEKVESFYEDKQKNIMEHELTTSEKTDNVETEGPATDHRNIDVVEVEDIEDDSDTETIETDKNAEELITATDDEYSFKLYRPCKK